MSIQSLLCFTLLALASTTLSKPIVIDSPPISFPLTKRLSSIQPPYNLLKHDQARAAALIQAVKGVQPESFKRDGISTSVTNVATTYIAKIGVGTPPEMCAFELVLVLRLEQLALKPLFH